jgi:hypothetical protein
MLVFVDVRRHCNEEEAKLFAIIAKAIRARRNGMIYGYGSPLVGDQLENLMLWDLGHPMVKKV